MKLKTKKELNKMTQKEALKYTYRLLYYIENLIAYKIDNVKDNDLLRHSIRNTQNYCLNYVQENKLKDLNEV
jgi:hypothetical protein